MVTASSLLSCWVRIDSGGELDTEDGKLAAHGFAFGGFVRDFEAGR